MKMVVSFKIDSSLKDTLQKLAEKENRSLSNYIITLLIRHLEEKGIDYKKDKPSKTS
jgi:predicted transcriptional regulator